MDKFYGFIGYVESKETPPDSGIWEDVIVERECYGDILKISSNRVPTDTLNGNVVLNSQFSILADPYAYQKFSNAKYIKYMDQKWEVKVVEPRYPRLIITVGGVYNGKTTN